METKQCPSCGSSIQGASKFCPECGYRFDPPPEEVQPQETPPLDPPPAPAKVQSSARPINKKLIFILCSIVVLICVAAAVIVSNNQKKAAAAAAAEYRATYISNLQSAKTVMLTAAAASEDIANLTVSVWHDTIYQEINYDTYLYTVRKSKMRNSGDAYKDYVHYRLNKDDVMYDDFNDSLNALFSSEEVISKVTALSETRDKVTAFMPKLQNPPKDLELCYSTITDMYNSFLQLTTLATDPTGSYNSYSEKFGELDAEFMKLFNQLEIQIPTE